MSGRIILAPMLFAALASNAPASGQGGIAKQLGDTTVETGRVFQSGGTDGLILYAMILGTFLMFLVAVGMAVLVMRSQKNHSDAMARAQADHAAAMKAKDEQAAGQTKLMIEGMDRTAVAITALSVAVGTDASEKAANRQTFAAIEVLLGQLQHVE